MRDGRRFRYPRSARVRRGSEIRILLRDGTRRRCGPLELFRSAAHDEKARAGIVVPRYGHTNVERNRLKRRLSEIVRTTWLPEARERQAMEDILLRARPAAYTTRFAELREAFRRCTEAVP